MQNKKIVVLGVILLFSFLIRIYKLTQIPSGFYVDEAVIGYNANSILVTGMDEYGKKWPVFLRSYNAFSSPLYTYLTTLPVLIGGMSIATTRILSAIAGSLSVIFYYLFTKKLGLFKDSFWLIVSTLLFSIAPWNLFFSRGAFEANLSLMILLAALFTLVSAKKKRKLFIVFSLLLAISTYSYQATRLSAFMLFVFGYIFVNGQKSMNFYKDKYLILSFCIFLLLQLPQIVLMSTPAFTSRAAGLFYTETINEQADKLANFFPYFIAFILTLTRTFLAHLTSYFSPKNLFFLADADMQRSVPELSVLYSWMVVPYIAGVVLLLTKLKNANHLFILALAFAFVVPAALTKDPFSTLRSLPLVVPVLIIITIGFKHLVRSLKTKLRNAVVIVLILLSLTSLYRSYFILFPYQRARDWGWGYYELVKQVDEFEGKVVVDMSRMKPFYIIYAFHSDLDPYYLQALNSDVSNYYDNFDFSGEYKIENIDIRYIYWEEDVYREVMLVGDDYAISPGQVEEHFLSEKFKVYDPAGDVIFKAYKTDPKKKMETEAESLD